MGLDMYLIGDRFRSSINAQRKTLDGFPVSTEKLDLGYWRKHPDLHGYIVENFSDAGEDNCQDIWLGTDELQKLIADIATGQLNHKTTGFFFGASYQPGEQDEWGSYTAQRAEDLRIFNAALVWLLKKKKDIWKNICYCASW